MGVGPLATDLLRQMLQNAAVTMACATGIGVFTKRPSSVHTLGGGTRWLCRSRFWTRNTIASGAIKVITLWALIRTRWCRQTNGGSSDGSYDESCT